MDRLFDMVFVRPPAQSYVECISTNPARNDIDVRLATEQHRNYVSILKESGIDVIELPPLEDFPDSVFMQDPAIIGSRRSVIGRFGVERRRGEEKVFVGELKNFNDQVGEIAAINEPGSLEGGDIIVSDHGLFVGESSRTNSSGIQQLAAYVRSLEVKAVKTDLFHLLCGCAYLNNRTMIIASELVAPTAFPGFCFIRIPKSDAYAADALYVGEGKVLVPAGFPKTNMKLRDQGYRPVEVEVSEFWKGDGGVTCLSSPIYKVF